MFVGFSRVNVSDILLIREVLIGKFIIFSTRGLQDFFMMIG